MRKVDAFTSWANSVGAWIEVAQEDDGSGYTVLWLVIPVETDTHIQDTRVSISVSEEELS